MRPVTMFTQKFRIFLQPLHIMCSKKELISKVSFNGLPPAPYNIRLVFIKVLTQTAYESDWQFILGCICLSFRGYIFPPPCAHLGSVFLQSSSQRQDSPDSPPPPGPMSRRWKNSKLIRCQWEQRCWAVHLLWLSLQSSHPTPGEKYF